MMKISRVALITCAIACQMMTAELHSQDLPESWVNPPPDPDDVPTYTFEPSPLEPLVSMGPDGKLVYKSYSDKGDRVLDWSKTGYRQSDVPIPDAPVMDTLSPLPGDTNQDGNMAYPKGPDSREEIQAALYKVWQMTPNADGVKGAVLLKAGTWYVYGSLFIPPGVVLRGEGNDENGTIIIFRTASGGGNAINIGQGNIVNNWGSTVRITDDYVPSGSYEVTVTDASSFKPGDYVYIRKTVNQKWIDDLGVGERLRHIRGGEEGAGKTPWKPESYQFMHLRQITEVNGNTITLDVMMPQSIANEHGGGEVLKADVASLATHCGVESLRLVSNYDKTIKDTGKDANFLNFGTAVSISNAMNSWVRNVSVKHLYFAAVNIGDGSRQITVRDCKNLEPVGPKRGGFRYPFNMGGGTGHLVYNCFSEDGRHDFSGGSRTMGPFAFVNSTAVRGGQSEPHHRWGTGFLFDNITTKDGSIASINRGDSGSGHGWAGANAMVWNCDAPNIVVFDPETEGENNFAIGYSGDQTEGFGTDGLWYANTRAGYWGTPQEGKFYGYALMGSGYIESPTEPVEPKSLFVQQLIERVGIDQAMRVLDDDRELASRVSMVGIFSAYPELEKVNDSTFIMLFNMPVFSPYVVPENFSVSGNTGYEEAEFSTTVVNDSVVRLGFEGIGLLPMFSKIIVEAKNLSSLTGKPLEGLTTATYVEPDLRPVVTGYYTRVNNEDGLLEALSSKPGSIYIVKSTEDYYYLETYQDVSDLEQAVADNLGRKVEVPYPDKPVSISTKGLPGGFYLYYAVDEESRLSEPADELAEVLQTGPISGMEDEMRMSGFSVWSSHGTIYIQPDDHSAEYSVRIFDMTGKLFNVRDSMKSDQQFRLADYRGILIVQIFSENGLHIKTYKLLHNPSR
jgi:hypothetical protein